MPTKGFCFTPCPERSLQMVKDCTELRHEVRCKNHLERFREPIFDVVAIVVRKFPECDVQLRPAESQGLARGPIGEMPIERESDRIVSGELAHHLPHRWRDSGKAIRGASVFDLDMEGANTNILCTLDLDGNAGVC